MKRGTQVAEPKLVITIMIVGIAILSWYVVFQLIDNSAVDQIFIANQVRYIVYSVASFPYDQNVTFDLSEQKNYTVAIVDDTVGVLQDGFLTFSYSTKMNLPSYVNAIGSVKNFSKVCVSRSRNTIEISECT